jgi:hypothetical protein
MRTRPNPWRNLFSMDLRAMFLEAWKEIESHTLGLEGGVLLLSILEGRFKTIMG